MAQSITITGLDALIRRLDGASSVLKDDVDAECEAAAHEMNAEASSNITSNGLVDNGELLSSQQVIDDKPNRSYTVQNVAFYAPFQEFGTGVKFEANQEWTAIAAEFKGAQNGNFAAFLQKITEWCSRKGIEEKYAYVICRSILNNGLRARPFMQPAYEKVAPELLDRIDKLIKDALG